MVVNIIGAGLAGCEAAYYLARHKIHVKLYEMRPLKMTPAHKTDKFGELVCSNSLRSDMIDVASGALKREMELFSSLVIEAARATKVEAGSALAVSREDFSQYITDKIKNNEYIEVIYEEVNEIDLNNYTIIATGPLTSDSLCEFIRKEFGMDDFYFFDAQAPIIKKDSIDMNIAYLKSRYDKGEAAYINCPMTEEEFNLFYNELFNARSAELHDFDCDLKVFEGCMPVEVMAKRGRQTLLFGPLKPKGLAREGYEKPYAVVQLRQDDAEQTLYNLVGFQTHLAFPEQKRVFSMIPGLKDAEFVKYGRMHKNTYINSPAILNATYQSKKYPNVFFAGQITGVEGYVESSASGIYAAINMLRLIEGENLVVFPKETIMGSMANYISIPNSDFQPINANFGIVPEVLSTTKIKKKDRKLFYGERAINTMKEFITTCKIKI